MKQAQEVHETQNVPQCISAYSFLHLCISILETFYFFEYLFSTKEKKTHLSCLTNISSKEISSLEPTCLDNFCICIDVSQLELLFEGLRGGREGAKEVLKSYDHRNRQKRMILWNNKWCPNSVWQIAFSWNCVKQIQWKF